MKCMLNKFRWKNPSHTQMTQSHMCIWVAHHSTLSRCIVSPPSASPAPRSQYPVPTSGQIWPLTWIRSILHFSTLRQNIVSQPYTLKLRRLCAAEWPWPGSVTPGVERRAAATRVTGGRWEHRHLPLSSSPPGPLLVLQPASPLPPPPAQWVRAGLALSAAPTTTTTTHQLPTDACYTSQFSGSSPRMRRIPTTTTITTVMV